MDEKSEKRKKHKGETDKQKNKRKKERKKERKKALINSLINQLIDLRKWGKSRTKRKKQKTKM